MHLVDPPPIVPVVAPSLPRFFGFGYAGSCQSAMEVGGDFFEVCPLSESSLLLAVADVMGKGSAAALFAGTLRTLVHAVVVLDPCLARTLTRELERPDVPGVAFRVRHITHNANLPLPIYISVNYTLPTPDIAPCSLPRGTSPRWRLRPKASRWAFAATPSFRRKQFRLTPSAPS